jgi:hypothetical protein
VADIRECIPGICRVFSTMGSPGKAGFLCNVNLSGNILENEYNYHRAGASSLNLCFRLCLFVFIPAVIVAFKVTI